MKKYLLLCMLLWMTIMAASQSVGIGTSSPHPSAILELNSNNKGLLLPRLTTSQINALASPANGLVVFNTDDTSLYIRRNSAFGKLAVGEDNLWKRVNNSLHPQALSIGIGYTNPLDQNYLGQYAPLQVKGLVGNTAALFGADQRGIALVADYPGVFFNSYFNGGVKSLSPGNSGNITLNQANADGGYLEFRFGGYTNFYDVPLPNVARMILNNDGKLGINMSAVPTRAMLEQRGSVGTTAAIFGGDGAGVAIEKNWPAIGFNHYFDGTHHRSMAQGFSAQLGINQVNGSLYLASWPFAALTDANLDVNPYTQRFYVSRFGRLGLGTDDPWTDIHIRQDSYNFDAVNDPTSWRNGIVLQSPDGNYWNISDDKVKTCVNVNLGVLDPLGIIGSLVNGCTTYDAMVFQYNGVGRSCIRSDGEYRQLSDARFKKDISPLSASSGLAAVMKLNPVSYHFLNEQKTERLHTGFIAQEVEKIFPEFVDEIGNQKVLGYQSFIPVLTRAIQEQQEQIDILKKQNEEMRKEMEQLKKLIQSKQ